MDEQGFDDWALIAYWDDVKAYDRWFNRRHDALIGAGVELEGHGG